MFSFFKRSKTKDDNDKNKKSSSLVTKHQDKASSSKPSVVENTSRFLFGDFSFGKNTTTHNTEIEHPKCETDRTNNDPDHNMTKTTLKREQNIERDEASNLFLNKRAEFFNMTPESCKSVSEHLVSGNKNSNSISLDSENSDLKCKTEETSVENDVDFKTAPNTPDLSKHINGSNDDIFDCDSEEIKTILKLNLKTESDYSDTNSTVEVLNTEQPLDENLTSNMERIVSTEGLGYPGNLYDISEESASDDDSAVEGVSADVAKKNIVNQEAKYQQQIEDLVAQLETRETETKTLLYRINELQRNVDVKTGGMERLQAELIAAQKESEIVHRKLRKLEENLDDMKQKNSDLVEEISREPDNSTESCNYLRIIELQEQIKDLESQICTLKTERDTKLILEEKKLNKREEEFQMIQEALVKVLSEKDMIQKKFEQDFEKLRTVNTDREQQLLDDFEWKLREVEQTCKKKLDEKEHKIKEMESELIAIRNDLSRVEVLKQFEAEAIQLRGVNSEQQKALKVASKKNEQLCASEKSLTEEIQRLKSLLEREKKNLTTVQGIHNREISEKDRKLHFKLEQQKNELNNEWEEKLRKETVRIKCEIERYHKNEKRQALDKLKEDKEEELRLEKLKLTSKHQDMQKEIEILKERLSEQNKHHFKELSDAQTRSDQDIFDLRRKLDKIDITYQEEIEKIQEKNEQDIVKLKEDHDKKLQLCEQNCQLQIGTTRTTLELVKEQLQKESQEKLQALCEHHKKQLEEQWEQLVQERDETVAELEQIHRATTEKLQAELEALCKTNNTQEHELMNLITKLKLELTNKNNIITELQNNNNSMQGGIQKLNHEISIQKDHIVKIKQEDEMKLSCTWHPSDLYIIMLPSFSCCYFGPFSITITFVVLGLAVLLFFTI
uniref:Uncharacterized protein n=1 Tax=Clastoptera arizonana TaxID=38151 RepID=A0A1B6C1G2_9HEMI